MAATHALSDLLPPHLSKHQELPFMGYHRSDGRVGVQSYWLVIPLFVGDSQQMTFLEDALLTGMGCAEANPYLPLVRKLREQYRAGSYFEADTCPDSTPHGHRVFSNIDGIKFLPNYPAPGEPPAPHDSCWEVLAGYCSQPNVAGVTVLNLAGDEYIDLLRQHICTRDPNTKTLLVMDRQRFDTTFDWFTATLRDTFRAMAVANRQTRRPASLSSLTVGPQVSATVKLADESPVPAEHGHFLTRKGATVLCGCPDAVFTKYAVM